VLLVLMFCLRQQQKLLPGLRMLPLLSLVLGLLLQLLLLLLLSYLMALLLLQLVTVGSQ
jgi:hypothetical protein